MAAARTTTTKLSGTVWILLYFLANLVLTIHNKWVMARLRFTYPWILTAVHIGISGAGAYLALLLVHRQPPQPVVDRHSLVKLFLFSILYAVNIAISNVSLRHVSLAFHQVVRSSTPAFTVAIEAGLFSKLPSLAVSLSLLPVMLGVCLATADEFGRNGYTLDGFWLTVLGVLLSALKGIVTNGLLVGKLKLHPLDLLWKMSLSSTLQCIVYSWSLGELQQLKDYQPPNDRLLDAVVGIIANGLLAFVLNWVSFAANQKTSALSMTVAGNVKQALSIALAVWIFATPVSALNAVGIGITLRRHRLYLKTAEETDAISLSVSMETGVGPFTTTCMQYCEGATVTVLGGGQGGHAGGAGQPPGTQGPDAGKGQHVC